MTEQNYELDSEMYSKEYAAFIRLINTQQMPYFHKLCLTIEEASKYSGIGINRMRELADRRPELCLWNGTKRLIKRAKLEKYLENEYSI